MAFTYEQIIALENPYKKLSTGDALAENQDVLNALSDDEKNTLATKIINACPQAKLKHYFLQIEALNNLKNTSESFYPVISAAYQVRKRIFALMDPRNKNPHTLLLGAEFNPELFHRFQNLTQISLKNNEHAIAERLALCTPAAAHSKIARNIDTAFPKSTLTTTLQTAFSLHRNINRLLLGANPEQFFTCRDYKKEICDRFIVMFRTLLKGKEQEIADKLAAVAPKDRENIMHQLELLSTKAFDKTNPFKLIAEHMYATIIKSPKEIRSRAFFEQPNISGNKPIRIELDPNDEKDEEKLEEENDKTPSFF